MAFGSFNSAPKSAPMAEINVIPLVDIMLVLLVIFIITAPLLTHSVKLDLPQANSAPTQVVQQPIQISINASGDLFWNGQAITVEDRNTRLQQAAQQQPAPDLHIHADRNARYEVIAQTLSEASRLGLTRIAFVTDPQSSTR